MTDSLVNGLLKSVSLRMDNLLQNAHDKQGCDIIRLFLDCILFDSCSQEVRSIFVHCFKEQLSKISEEKEK